MNERLQSFQTGTSKITATLYTSLIATMCIRKTILKKLEKQ